MPVIFAKGDDTGAAKYWTSDGAGGFVGPTSLDPSGNGTAATAVVGDFDGDGASDVLVGRVTGNWWSSGLTAVHAFFNDCGSEFEEVELEDNSDEFDVSGAADLYGAVDLDLDGDLDVVGWDSNDGDGWVWLNSGDGEAWDRLPPSSDFLRPFYLSYWSSGGAGSVALPPVDMSGDGFPDIVECGPTNWVAPTNCLVHRGDADGTFTDSWASFTVDQNVNGFALADFDGDGTIDYLGGFDDDDDAGQAWIWFTDPVAGDLPSGPGVEALDVNVPDLADGSQDDVGRGWPYPYDWDDDGDMDVIISIIEPFPSNDRVLYVGLNDGTGSFTVTEVGESAGAWGGSSSWEFVQEPIGVPAFP